MSDIFPDFAQTDALYQLVVREYAKLVCPRSEFAAAMKWCCFVRRTPELDTSRSIGFWVDTCSAWLRLRNERTIQLYSALTAACIASGIAFSKLDRWPFDMAFGIGLGDTSRPNLRWADVLRAGKLPPPTELRRNRPAEIVQLNMLRSEKPGMVRYGST